MLYHFALSPACRFVRLALAEKDISFNMAEARPWERPPELLRLNPAGEVPTLQEPGGEAICEAWAIAEYLDEMVSTPPLLGHSPQERAETRRLAGWFLHKFCAEVAHPILTERVLRRVALGGEPNGMAIRAATANLQQHLQYVSYLVERRNWLAGSNLSLADLAAAGAISCLDYLGVVAWEQHANAKEWYMRIKSRKAMRGILSDRLANLPPASHYAELDF